jgi:hypothetical protein
MHVRAVECSHACVQLTFTHTHRAPLDLGYMGACSNVCCPCSMAPKHCMHAYTARVHTHRLPCALSTSIVSPILALTAVILSKAPSKVQRPLCLFGPPSNHRVCLCPQHTQAGSKPPPPVPFFCSYPPPMQPTIRAPLVQSPPFTWRTVRCSQTKHRNIRAVQASVTSRSRARQQQARLQRTRISGHSRAVTRTSSQRQQ